MNGLACREPATDENATGMRSEITTPDVLGDEGVMELSLRPQRLAEFIGQSKLKDSLRIALDAALVRREALDHTLFFGPPGLGKTTLAMLLARELGVNIKITSGPVLEKAGDLVQILTNLRSRDILFIDEIHRLRPVLEEYLYPAMEDYRIEIRLGEGPKAQTLPVEIERFTLVGATTRFGLLTPPMRARFGIVNRLNYYSPDDLCIIVSRSAEILQVECTPDGATEIARRARGTPRVANRLLRRVRDYAQVRASGVITANVAGEALLLLDVDEYGLDEMDGKILTTLIETGRRTGRSEFAGRRRGRGCGYTGAGVRAVPDSERPADAHRARTRGHQSCVPATRLRAAARTTGHRLPGKSVRGVV